VTSAVVLVALAAPMGAAAARDDRALPRTGLAVETNRGVDLVGLDGRVRRTLPGYRFRVWGVERRGQIELRDRSGRGYDLRAGVLAPRAADQMRLPAGYALRLRRSSWALLRAGRVVARFGPFTVAELDDSAKVLTSFRVAKDGAILTVPVARHLGTGARRILPRGCRVGAERASVRFELCGYPYVKRGVSTVVRVDGSGRRTIAGPAHRAPRGPTGWWRSVTLSADGRRLLAQWSGECEIPFAYVIDTRSGRATVLGRDQRGGQAEALTLGWLGDAALVTLPHGACGSSAERPGVYVFDRRGRARLIHPLPNVRPLSVAFWR
jgi:hypothetical protein